MSVTRGRPRDLGIDERVRSATRAILEEQGFAETTVMAVAQRAGVGSAAIYRRWPSRISMIEDAILPDINSGDVALSGDLREDIGRFVALYCLLLDHPAVRAAAPGLLSAFQSQPEYSRFASLDAHGSVRDAFRTMLRTAPPGSVDPLVNPDDVFDILIGAVMFRSLIRPSTGRDMTTDYITESILRAVTPVGDRRPI